MLSISRNFITPFFRCNAQRTCSSLWSKSSLLAQPTLSRQQTASLLTQSRASFFWSKPAKNAQDSNNSSNNESNNTKRITEEELNNPSQWDSLGFLMDQFKSENRAKKPLLPPQDPKYHGKITVVIEMDEILFYTFVPDEHEAYINAPLKDHDYYFELPEFDTYLSVYKRPHLEEFLKFLREHTEPILFTKGVKAYADKVLELVDPEKTFAHVLTNEDCGKIVYPPEDMDEYVKDLENLNRDMKKLIYIDSQPVSFWTAPDNALPTSSYYAELHDVDTQLLDLIEELKFLETQEDVRTILTEEFKVRETLKQSRFL